MEVERCSGALVSIPVGGHKVDALFRDAVGPEDSRRRLPVLLRLHGVLGNLLDETEHFLPTALAARGYASISMNTLLANLGLFYGFGVFDDVIPQIDAACEFLRTNGFTRIVLAGHGLGAAMAVRYAAARNDPATRPDLHGVVAIAAPYSLPATIRRRWERFGSEPSYGDVSQRATQAIAAGCPGQDETIVIRRAHGPTRRPEHTEIYTLKTWWSLAGPEADGPTVHRHIGRVSIPLLLIDAGKDEVLERRDGEDLSLVARAAGNPDVTRIVFDANHAFDGMHHELAETVLQWLAARCGGETRARG